MGVLFGYANTMYRDVKEKLGFAVFLLDYM